MTGAEPWIIGPMDEAHCGQAAALEVLCFSDPWGQESFRDFSASRLYRTFGAAPAEDGDLAGALEAQYKLAPLRIATNMGTFPQTIKEALVMQGLPVGKCLDPIQELSPAQKETLRGVLQQMELI